MLVIRKEQMQVFELDVRRRYIDRLMAHFSKVWPEKTQALGDQYRPTIEKGVDKAKGYGLEMEQHIARYLNLWFVWGVEFEDLPEFQWAKEILEDPEREPELKVHQLVWRSEQELNAENERN